MLFNNRRQFKKLYKLSFCKYRTREIKTTEIIKLVSYLSLMKRQLDKNYIILDGKRPKTSKTARFLTRLKQTRLQKNAL